MRSRNSPLQKVDLTKIRGEAHPEYISRMTHTEWVKLEWMYQLNDIEDGEKAAQKDPTPRTIWLTEFGGLPVLDIFVLTILHIFMPIYGSVTRFEVLQYFRHEIHGDSDK